MNAPAFKTVRRAGGGFMVFQVDERGTHFKSDAGTMKKAQEIISRLSLPRKVIDPSYWLPCGDGVGMPRC